MHQANQRILDAAAQRLGLPAERVRDLLSKRDVVDVDLILLPQALLHRLHSVAGLLCCHQVSPVSCDSGTRVREMLVTLVSTVQDNLTALNNVPQQHMASCRYAAGLSDNGSITVPATAVHSARSTYTHCAVICSC